MKYMGSKSRHAKYILPIILKGRVAGQYYVEPFVGGANLIDKVTGNRIGSDSNKYLIALLQSVSKGSIPNSITKQQYNDIRSDHDSFDNDVVGYAGIVCSYNGKWFGGFTKDTLTKIGTIRKYQDEARRNLEVQSQNLEGIEFTCSDYRSLGIPANSIIYCDPPYLSTTGYKDAINHDEFWAWCDRLVWDGHTVFVSEYEAPYGWECVWEKEVNSSMTQDTGSKKATEKLFTKPPGYMKRCDRCKKVNIIRSEECCANCSNKGYKLKGGKD